MSEAADPDRSDHRGAALAALAHESLADARSATLLVDGVGHVGPNVAANVTLCERGGRPVLLCPAAARLAAVAAGGCSAVLTVPALGCDSASVVFLGRLQVASIHGAADERTAVLELAPASILLEEGRAGDERFERVDLSRYSSHCRRTACCSRPGTAFLDDQVRRTAERIRIHTNDHHAAALAAAAARLTGQPPEAVAGASLVALDRAGALLDWADGDGGHRIGLSFRRPADDGATLARSLRAALEGTC